MPRNQARKTNIGQHTDDNMREALNKIFDGQKIRAVAKLMNIPYTTLYRYYVKIKKSSCNDPLQNERLTPNYSVRKIFTDHQEKTMVEYLTSCSKMFYGFTLLDTRKLAYEMAVINNITVPQKWHETKLAGADWLYSLRKRYPNLSLRTPEGCSLSRSTSFNRHNVSMFYDNLENCMSRHETFGNGYRVFNLDETNTMTVQQSAKVLAVKGQRQVSKVTSAERGTLVTTCYIVNALGSALPPVMFFPRVHFKSHMIKDAPSGTLGLATQNGWMNGQLFVETMRHFIKLSNSSKDNPSLLILDNHESHICIEALNLAKDNGVTILTVPPHSTGKLQPLDVGIFGPFKVAYNRAVDSWMMRNPGKTFSIYDVAGCVTEAHMKAMTPNNICNAFKATGIFPFDRDLFTDDDFAPSGITDRPLETEHPDTAVNRSHTQEVDVDDRDRTRTPTPSILLPSVQNESLSNPPRLSVLAFEIIEQSAQKVLEYSISKFKKVPDAVECTPSTSTAKPYNNVSPSRSGAETQKPFVSPFDFRGLPKAGSRKRGRVVRKKGKSMIATDTPNKNEIEQKSEEKNKRKKRKESANKIKRKVLDSETEEEDTISLYSEEEPTLDVEEEIVFCVDPKKFRPLEGRPKEGNFVLVEFEVKGKNIYYIAKVLGDKQTDIEVSFLRKSVKNPNKFIVPNVPDIATATFNDVKMILPQPGFTGGTKRMQGMYNFDLDFSKIDLR